MGAISTSAPDLWLKADAITGLSDGDPVTTWVDSSGNSRDASGGTSPTYKTSILNGLPVVRFNGTSQYLTSTASTSAAAQTVIAVVNPTTGSTYRGIRGTSNTGGVYFRIDNDNRPHIDMQGVSAVGSSYSTVATSSWHVLGMSFKSGAAAFRNDGVNSLVLTGANTPTASRTTVIGSKQGADEWFPGDMAEIITWSRRLTMAEWTAIEAELNTKYALTPAATEPAVTTGTATDSSNAGGGWESYHLHDNVVGGAGVSWSAAGPVPGTVKLQIEDALGITGYTVTARTDAGTSAPAAWTIDGSNDNSSWTTLDTQTAQTFSNGQARTYTASSSTAYLYYRMVITATVGGAAWPSFTELRYAFAAGATSYAVAGQVDAVSATDGTVTLNAALDGAVAGTSAASGDVTAQHPLDGTTAAVSGTEGALVTGFDYAVAGQVDGTSSTAGDLGLNSPVAGQVDAVSGVEGDLSVSIGVAGQVDAVSGTQGAITLTGGAQTLSGGFSFGDALTSGAITVAAQTLSGGFSFGSTLASLVVAIQQLEGGFSFGGRLTQQRDWGIDPRSTRPTPSVVIAHRDGMPVTNLDDVRIGELTSAVGALDSWQFSVDRDNAAGKKVDPVALEAHLYRGSVLMSKGPIGPGRLSDGRMVYDCSDPRWYLWDGRHIDRRPRLNWVYNGDFRLGTAGWTGGYEPGSIPEAIPVFSVVDEPESTSGKGLKIGGVDKVVTSVTDVETAAVFVPNSSAYLSGGAAVLIAAASGIPDGSNINIVGHTADRRAYGDPGNGLALSLARAQAARSTLHAHNATWTFSLLPGLASPNQNDGVVAGRGYYEQVASNSTEASSAKNRRVALHYSSTQTAAGHKQFVYQRKTSVVNPVSSKVALPVVISGRMRIGQWLGAPANGYALWAQVYNAVGVAVGASAGSVEPATATMNEQTPRERFIDYDVTVNIPPDGQTYSIVYRLFPPAGWAVWSDIEVTPDEQLGFFDVDQALIIRDLVAFAQNPAYGHGPLGIGSRTPLTGITRTKEYKFSEHRPVGTAVEDLTSMAHGPEVDCEMTPTSATVVTHYPRQGTVAAFSLAHGGPRSIVKAYQPLPANTRTLASSVVVQAWGISNNRYERFVKDDAALGGTLLETVIDADAATPVNELAEVARQSLARSIHPLAAWEVTLDPARTSEVLDEIGKGDVVLLSLPDEAVHALHRIVSVIWEPETDTLTLQLAPEEV